MEIRATVWWSRKAFLLDPIKTTWPGWQPYTMLTSAPVFVLVFGRKCLILGNWWIWAERSWFLSGCRNTLSTLWDAIQTVSGYLKYPCCSVMYMPLEGITSRSLQFWRCLVFLLYRGQNSIGAIGWLCLLFRWIHVIQSVPFSSHGCCEHHSGLEGRPATHSSPPSMPRYLVY